MSQEIRFGLEEKTIAKISKVFKKHQEIQAAVIYGSRAKGNYKPGSDIDLTLKAPTLNTTDLLKIENELEELLLPYKIDLSLFHQIETPDLIEHINRIGIIFYQS